MQQEMQMLQECLLQIELDMQLEGVSMWSAILKNGSFKIFYGTEMERHQAKLSE